MVREILMKEWLNSALMALGGVIQRDYGLLPGMVLERLIALEDKHGSASKAFTDICCALVSAYFLEEEIRDMATCRWYDDDAEYEREIAEPKAKRDRILSYAMASLDVCPTHTYKPF